MKFVKNALTPSIAVISVAIFAMLNAQADVLEVGEGKSYTDIATAIGDAMDNDTVLVYDGIYGITEQISVTKAITLKSANGAAVTELKRTDRGDPLNMNKDDPGVVKRVLFVNNAAAVVDGLTISGGYVAKTTGEYGAGVCIGELGGTLVNCIVSNNLTRTTSYGGGVAMLGEKSVVTNCTITANYGVMVGAAEGYGYGAGVYLVKGLLTHSNVCDNNPPNKAVESAGRTGRGMYGAGIYMVGGAVSHCYITGNRMENGSANVGTGGGVYMTAGAIDNCLIAHNQAKGYANIGEGGGIWANGSNVSIANCTIVDNEAFKTYGGLYLGHQNIAIANTVVFGNTAVAGSPEWGGNSLVVFRNCLSSVPLTSTAVNSQVVDDARLDAECRPTGASACVDNGWDDVLAGAVVTDLAGGDRYAGSAIDIGCFEYEVPKFSADIEKSADKWTVGGVVTLTAKVQSVLVGDRLYRWRIDGGEWGAYDSADAITVQHETAGDHTVELQVMIGGAEQTAVSDVFYLAPLDIYVAPEGGDYADVREGLDRARRGTTVHLAPGVYPIEGDQLVVGDGISLIGDQGADVTEIRRTDAGVSGTVLAAGDAAVDKRVILIEGAGAIVCGLTISGGYLAKVEGSFGAGVCVKSDDGRLTDCVITNNVSRGASYGAGVALVGANALASNCVIACNSPIRFSNADGDTLCGGVYALHGHLVDSLVMSNNLPRADITIAGGKSATGNDVEGSGVYAASGSRISRCRIEGNRASGVNPRPGTGIYAVSAVIDNCLIVGNVNSTTGNNPGSGGGVSASGSWLINCTVVGNSARTAGGIAARDTAVRVVNCIVQGNTATDADGSDDYSVLGPVTKVPSVKYSLSLQAVEGEGNLLGSATFVGTDDWHLTALSLGLRTGSVVGNESYLVGGFDLDGMPRTVTRKNLIDMGCYQREYVKGLMLLVR